MSKVAPVRRDGEIISHAVWCPACEMQHQFATPDHPGCPHDGWTYNGDPDRPTFSPSMLAEQGEGRRCHSFVTDGEFRYCADSTHELAGETVEVPDWPWPTDLEDADGGDGYPDMTLADLHDEDDWRGDDA